jgi:hypothetical protein
LQIPDSKIEILRSSVKLKLRSVTKITDQHILDHEDCSLLSLSLAAFTIHTDLHHHTMQVSTKLLLALFSSLLSLSWAHERRTPFALWSSSRPERSVPTGTGTASPVRWATYSRMHMHIVVTWRVTYDIAATKMSLTFSSHSRFSSKPLPARPSLSMSKRLIPLRMSRPRSRTRKVSHRISNA